MYPNKLLVQQTAPPIQLLKYTLSAKVTVNAGILKLLGAHLGIEFRGRNSRLEIIKELAGRVMQDDTIEVRDEFVKECESANAAEATAAPKAALDPLTEATIENLPPEEAADFGYFDELAKANKTRAKEVKWHAERKENLKKKAAAALAKAQARAAAKAKAKAAAKAAPAPAAGGAAGPAEPVGVPEAGDAERAPRDPDKFSWGREPLLFNFTRRRVRGDKRRTFKNI